MSKTKIIAMYLPQFHCIPENDEFWGKGFTDWVTVKKAKPLFDGHQQPRVPLNENYYDLSKEEHVRWQCKIAKEYGIYGFGIYHYWFNNEKNLLTKPAEIIRDNKDIDMNYFFAWDNCSWRRTWSNLTGNSNAWAPVLENNNHSGPSTLIEYILGGEKEWKTHYDYVKTHFKEDRYIKIDNMPVFIIFYYNEDIEKMCKYWNMLAMSDGYAGIHFIFKRSEKGKFVRKTSQPDGIYTFNYEPMFNGWSNKSFVMRVKDRILGIRKNNTPGLRVLDYDKVWTKLLKTAKGRCSDRHTYHGAFVSYDDTPRRGESRGIIIQGSRPEKFRWYLSQLIRLSQEQDKQFIFLTAWNEWGEGACLEPDTINGLDYLKVVNDCSKL